VLSKYAVEVTTAPGASRLAYDSPYLESYGNYFYAMQSGASVQHLGNGKTLDASNDVILFRDLDGVCAYPR
jgi:hypothetical protein